MAYGYHPLYLAAQTSAIELIHKIAVQAILRFRLDHVCEFKPKITYDLHARTVTVSAGATVTYGFDELGFTEVSFPS